MHCCTCISLFKLLLQRWHMPVLVLQYAERMQCWTSSTQHSTGCCSSRARRSQYPESRLSTGLPTWAYHIWRLKRVVKICALLVHFLYAVYTQLPQRWHMAVLVLQCAQCMQVPDQQNAETHWLLQQQGSAHLLSEAQVSLPGLNQSWRLQRTVKLWALLLQCLHAMCAQLTQRLHIAALEPQHVHRMQALTQHWAGLH